MTAAEPSPKLQRMRRWAIVAAKVVLSAAFIIAAFWAVDFEALIVEARRQSVALLLLALALMFAQLLVGAARWHFVRLGLGANPTARNSVELYYIGIFFGSFVISGASGDIMRGWLAYRSGASPANAANAVLYDRIVTVAGCTLIAFAGLPWFFARLGGTNWAYAPLLAIIALAVALLALTQMHRLPSAWAASTVGRIAISSGAAARSIFMRPRIAAPAMAASLAALLVLASVGYVLALGFHLPLSYLDCVVVVPLVTLASSIPITVGGWGLREAAMIAMLSLLGIPAHAALLLSVELGLLGSIAALPGGALWLAYRGARA